MSDQAYPFYDYLIVGQGLAGSLLAYKLIKRGMKVLVIDNAHQHSASQVAAGLINPITGHRLNLTDGFERIFPVTKKFYQRLNKEFDSPIYSELNQTRLIKNAGQADYFKKRKQQRDYKTYFSASVEHKLKDVGHGFTGIEQTAAVDTSLLLAQIKSWLIEQDSYYQKRVDYGELFFDSGNIKYKNFQAKNVIFCEGYQAIDNPWLCDLPFKLSKGDVLEVKTDLSANHLLSWGNWLGTNANGTHGKLGSTYKWNDTSHSIDADAKQQLLDSLKKHTTAEVDVINHCVGIRPTTVQRVPFVGALTSLKNAYCFNGFGSKGCLLIPYYADQLCDHLMNGLELDQKLTQWL